MLGLSETVAGVTLAALGNGSPDIFGTFTAIRAGAGRLAVGELLGATLFNTLVVVGAVAFTNSSERIPRRPFARDVLFLIGCVAILLAMIIDGKITALESLGLMAYYLIYVTVVIVGSYVYKQMKAAQRQESSRAAAHAASRAASRVTSRMGTVTELVNPEGDAPELEWPIDDEEEQDPSTLAMGTPRNSEFYSTDTRSLYHVRGSAFLPHLNSELFPFLSGITSAAELEIAGTPAKINLPDGSSAAAVGGDEEEMDASVVRKPSSGEGDFLSLSKGMAETLFPVVHAWGTISWRGKVLSVLTVPIVFLLKLSIPVVHRSEVEKLDRRGNDAGDELNSLIARDLDNEQDDEDDETAEVFLHKRTLKDRLTLENLQFLVNIQIIPIIFGFVLVEPAGLAQVLLTFLLSAGLGFSLAASMRHFGKLITPYSLLVLKAFCGFIMSIVWIYIVAREVVGLLQIVGVILGVDDAVMGLTLFAVGNSLGGRILKFTFAA
ncbi:hypothetical protein HDU76_011850 [Blyttiomyces sp. JEL0837]|nr:hypothetical protein HDU76_011850 [Blyttiomyces sp. JEL0837]